MATNKASHLFCRSRGGGNPIVLIACLVFLLGTFFAPAGFVVAGDCSDPAYQDSPAGRLECYATGEDVNGPITSFGGLVARFQAVIGTVVSLLVSVAVFIIIWGTFTYIRHSEDEEKRQEARLYVFWGVVGVFIMVSIWGFVTVLINTFPLKKTPVQTSTIFPSRE